MKFKTRALTEQELLNQEKEDQMEYNRIMKLSDKDEEILTPQQMKELDFPLTQTEQLPSTTTPTNNQQTQSESPIDSNTLQQVIPSLPPEIQQILAMVIPQLQSDSTLLDLVSMMNSQTDEEISDSTIEKLEKLFQ